MTGVGNMTSHREESRSRFCESHGIRAVIFDCDGVLLDSGEPYYTAYEKVLAEEGVATSPREIYRLEGMPTLRVLETVLAGRGKLVPSVRVREMVDLRRQYQAAAGVSKFFPGTWSMLARLRTSGYRVAMVTGSSRKSIDLSFTPDLKSHFDAIITADDVQCPKPHPQPFALASERIEVPTANCLVIENAPYGVQSARAAGCRVIAICTTLTEEDFGDAHWIVPDHSALKSLLWNGSVAPSTTEYDSGKINGHD